MAEFSVTLSQLQSKAEELEQLNSTFDGMIKTLDQDPVGDRSGPGRHVGRRSQERLPHGFHQRYDPAAKFLQRDHRICQCPATGNGKIC